MTTVAFLPVYHNPYQHLLTAALADQGVQVLHLDRLPALGWLWRQRRRVQILHLHWLYGLYMGRFLTPFTWAAFLLRLLFAQRLGYRIVWTAHNILPHRAPFPPMHLFVRRLMMSRADAVIAHCDYARQELRRRFPREEPVHVIAHGNYVSVHPIEVSRAQARAFFEVNQEAFLYLMLGNIARYKGVETFVASFQRVAGADDVALIAGRNRAPGLVAQLEQIAAHDPRLQLRPGFIPEDQMQYYLQAADVAVFCFDEILTSGSVILAMSYGLPIIAPAMGCLPELVTTEAGLLYDPADPDALGQALQRIKEMDTVAMGAAARAIADALDWDGIARQTAAIYRACLEGDPP